MSHRTGFVAGIWVSHRTLLATGFVAGIWVSQGTLLAEVLVLWLLRCGQAVEGQFWPKVRWLPQQSQATLSDSCWVAIRMGASLTLYRNGRNGFHLVKIDFISWQLQHLWVVRGKEVLPPVSPPSASLCPPHRAPSSVSRLSPGSRNQPEPARTSRDPPEAAPRSPHADPRPQCCPRDPLLAQIPAGPVQGVFPGTQETLPVSGVTLGTEMPPGLRLPSRLRPRSWAHTGERIPTQLSTSQLPSESQSAPGGAPGELPTLGLFWWWAAPTPFFPWAGWGSSACGLGLWAVWEAAASIAVSCCLSHLEKESVGPGEPSKAKQEEQCAQSTHGGKSSLKIVSKKQAGYEPVCRQAAWSLWAVCCIHDEVFHIRGLGLLFLSNTLSLCWVILKAFSVWPQRDCRGCLSHQILVFPCFKMLLCSQVCFELHIWPHPMLGLLLWVQIH